MAARAERTGQAIVSQHRTDRTVAVVPIRFTDSVARLTIAGRSVLDATVRALRAVHEIGPIVLALDGIGERECLAAIQDPELLNVRVSAPSASRWLAIQSALAVAGEGSAVLIQDPDRPLISPVAVAELLRESGERPSVVTALPVYSSIKRVVDGRVVATVPRDALHAAQSPWIFERRVLDMALRGAIAHGWSITHELELARLANIPVYLAEGHPYNVPIATHADARFAEMAVERRLVSIPGGVAAPAW
jgi:2-C-methyl-D-erythritol 4-phosphate cytidylyltransferase